MTCRWLGFRRWHGRGSSRAAGQLPVPEPRHFGMRFDLPGNGQLARLVFQCFDFSFSILWPYVRRRELRRQSLWCVPGEKATWEFRTFRLRSAPSQDHGHCRLEDQNLAESAVLFQVVYFGAFLGRRHGRVVHRLCCEYLG